MAKSLQIFEGEELQIAHMNQSAVLTCQRNQTSIFTSQKSSMTVNNSLDRMHKTRQQMLQCQLNLQKERREEYVVAYDRIP